LEKDIDDRRKGLGKYKNIDIELKEILIKKDYNPIQ